MIVKHYLDLQKDFEKNLCVTVPKLTPPLALLPFIGEAPHFALKTAASTFLRTDSHSSLPSDWNLRLQTPVNHCDCLNNSDFSSALAILFSLEQ